MMKFLSIFAKIGSKLFRVFATLFRSEAMKFVAAHKADAVKIVLEVAMSDLSSDEKRIDALGKLRQMACPQVKGCSNIM